MGSETAPTEDDRWADMLLKWKINEKAFKNDKVPDIVPMTEEDQKLLATVTP